MGLIAIMQRAKTNRLLADQISVAQTGKTQQQNHAVARYGPGTSAYRRHLAAQERFWRKMSARSAQ